MASTFSYKWIPDDVNRKIDIQLYKSGSLFRTMIYPQENGLAPSNVVAYCESLIKILEIENADAAIKTMQLTESQSAYDAAASTLDANKPASPVSLSDGDVTASILADAKIKILSVANSNKVNPYSLVPTYQADYTAAGITVDLYSLVFQGYGAAMKLEFYADADADGVQDGGETASGLPANISVRVYDATDATVYSDFTVVNGKVLAYGFATGSYVFAIFAPAGYNVTGGSLAKQITLTDDAVSNQGTRGITAIGSTPPSLGGFTAHIFTDTDGDGTQDGGESNVVSVPVIVTLVGSLGGRAYVANANGDFNVSNDLMPDAGGYTFDITKPGTHNVTNAGALTVPYAGRTVTMNAQTAFGNWGIVAA